MHTGGWKKTEWNLIYIEAPEDIATRVFEEKFNKNPCAVSCSCCGSDYSICEVDGTDYTGDVDPNRKKFIINRDELPLWAQVEIIIES